MSGRQRVREALLGALVLALGAVPAQATNILMNPGFETGDLAGWTTGGSSSLFGVGEDGDEFVLSGSGFSPGIVRVRSGERAFYAQLAFGLGTIPPSLVTLSQTVPVTPGTDYEVAFFYVHGEGSTLSSQSSDGSTILGTNVFIDGVPMDAIGSDNLLVPLVPGGGTDASHFARASGVFSAGARSSVEVTFQLQASGSNALVSYDDFSVAAVPEPGAAGLVLLGGAGLAGLRRRLRS